MDKLLAELFKLYKVDNEKDLIVARTKAGVKQDKLFASKKPEAVKLTEASAKQLTESAGVEFLPGYESRVLDYKITDETADRYGDIVRVKGIDLTNYRKNPVIQFAHDYKSTPVGATVKLTKNTPSLSLNALGLFMDDRVDDTGVSSTVFKLAKSGFMKASSIGFNPLKVNFPSDKEERARLGLGPFGADFIKSELLEWSPVPVPANPNALQNCFKELRAEELRDFGQTEIDVMNKYHFLGKEGNLLDLFAETLKAKQKTSDGSFPTIILPSKSASKTKEEEEVEKKAKEEKEVKEKAIKENMEKFQKELKELKEKHKPDTKEFDEGLGELLKGFINDDPIITTEEHTLTVSNGPTTAPVININIDKSIFEQHNVLAKEIKESIDKMNGLFEKMFSGTLKTSPSPGGDEPLLDLKKKSLYEPSESLLANPSL